MNFLRIWKQTIWDIKSRDCLKTIKRKYQTMNAGMELTEVVNHLKQFASLSLAESWDNVGLLVQPSSESHLVKSIFLTNDLTENVMDEAIKKNVNMIISYHPPIFAPFKSLTRCFWKERNILRAIENKIAIYSPHTTFDSVKGGINDWLAKGLGKGSVKPLEVMLAEDKRGTHRLSVRVGKDNNSHPISVHHLVNKVNEIEGVNDGDVEEHGNDFHVNFNCNSGSLLAVMQLLNCESPELLKKTTIFNLAKLPVEDTGIGRLCSLDEQVPVQTIIERIKAYLKLKHIRFASGSSNSMDPQQQLVKTVAICAGSGGSVLKSVKADMYLTGEMSHHEVLDAVSKGIHVVLCEHSNTERGFFSDYFKDALYNMLQSRVQIIVSAEDRDPITIV